MRSLPTLEIQEASAEEVDGKSFLYWPVWSKNDYDNTEFYNIITSFIIRKMFLGLIQKFVGFETPNCELPREDLCWTAGGCPSPEEGGGDERQRDGTGNPEMNF